MKKTLFAALSAALLASGACTTEKDEPDEELKALDLKISQMESDLADFHERMKTVDSDRGLRDQLTEDEALLKSRLERLRERARQKRPADDKASEH